MCDKNIINRLKTTKYICETHYMKTSLLWMNEKAPETEERERKKDRWAVSLRNVCVCALQTLSLYIVWSDSWRSLDNVASQRRHFDGFTCLDKGESLYLSVLSKAGHMLRDRWETLKHSRNIHPGISRKQILDCFPVKVDLNANRLFPRTSHMSQSENIEFSIQIRPPTD